MRRSSEFRRVRKSGTSHRGRYLILGVLEDARLSGIKVGFITTRRLGNAVIRNRVRRRLRGILVDVGDRIRPGRYLVTVARPAAAEAEFGELRREWIRLGRRAGIFVSEPDG